MPWRTVCNSRVAVVVLTMLAADGIGAQTNTGNLVGKVRDPQDRVVSGATVTLKRRGDPVVQVTDAQGEFRILNLQAGIYPIKVELQGFAPIEYPGISIVGGHDTTVEILLGAPVGSVIPINLNSSIRIAQGLQTATFDTLHGQVIVNLPDDAAAGDTISGTVIAEPKGENPNDRARNRAELQGYVVEVAGRRMSSWQSQPSARAASGGDPTTNRLAAKIESTLESDAKTAGVILKDQGGNTIGQAVLVVPSLPRTSAGPTAPNPNQFQLPALGQQGRPIQIAGPFDGSSSNTAVTWSQVQNAGGLSLLAESPRKCVFEAPANVTGPVELTLKERGVEVKNTYRNVGVLLSAPKTQLLKGESTTVTVVVSGLQDITQSIPLHLVKGGVVRMEGGDSQTKVIKPDEVKRGGTYSITRKITGQQAGGFSVTASVVVFTTCLQDETGNALTLNLDTGDYLFCPAQGRTPLSGFGIATRRGCIVTLTPDQGETRAQVRIDTCSKQGSATVQVGSAKRTFTITDRNLSDNTCVCTSSGTPARE